MVSEEVELSQVIFPNTTPALQNLSNLLTNSALAHSFRVKMSVHEFFTHFVRFIRVTEPLQQRRYIVFNPILSTLTYKHSRLVDIELFQSDYDLVQAGFEDLALYFGLCHA